MLLTADAFGVLPPVSLLDAEEVMYHFVSGFTAKLAGTEVGVTEPQAAFSRLLRRAVHGAQARRSTPSSWREKMQKHKARCILLNTGWSGGPYGVGKRISIKHTRALLDAALRRRARRQGRDRAAPGLQPADAEELPGRARRDPEPAQHLDRQGRLRRAGRRSCATCSARTSRTRASRSSASSR